MKIDEKSIPQIIQNHLKSEPRAPKGRLFMICGRVYGRLFFGVFWGSPKRRRQIKKTLTFSKKTTKASNNLGAPDGVGPQFYLKGHSSIRPAIYI